MEATIKKPTKEIEVLAEKNITNKFKLKIEEVKSKDIIALAAVHENGIRSAVMPLSDTEEHKKEIKKLFDKITTFDKLYNFIMLYYQIDYQ
jgi:recombinational DNA repair protein RecT